MWCVHAACTCCAYFWWQRVSPCVCESVGVFSCNHHYQRRRLDSRRLMTHARVRVQVSRMHVRAVTLLPCWLPAPAAGQGWWLGWCSAAAHVRCCCAGRRPAAVCEVLVRAGYSCEQPGLWLGSMRGCAAAHLSPMHLPHTCQVLSPGSCGCWPALCVHTGAHVYSCRHCR